MRIVGIHEKTISILPNMVNAHIDFIKMTCLTVTVVADAIRGDKPVVDYRSLSNGQYVQEAIREFA